LKIVHQLPKEKERLHSQRVASQQHLQVAAAQSACTARDTHLSLLEPGLGKVTPKYLIPKSMLLSDAV
jgi:hypothetical protein